MSDKCQIYKLERQALTKARRSEGWKNARHSPCFSSPRLLLLQPPVFPCKSSLPSLLLLSPLPTRCQSASSSLSSSTPLCPSLDLISDFPCQLVGWCFRLYFHLSLFCRAYQALLTALTVRYLSIVYLLETFSHHCSGHSQPACLARSWIL